EARSAKADGPRNAPILYMAQYADPRFAGARLLRPTATGTPRDGALTVYARRGPPLAGAAAALDLRQFHPTAVPAGAVRPGLRAPWGRAWPAGIPGHFPGPRQGWSWAPSKGWLSLVYVKIHGAKNRSPTQAKKVFLPNYRPLSRRQKSRKRLCP